MCEAAVRKLEFQKWGSQGGPWEPKKSWIAGQRWDLIVTMDDTTNEHYSMFFVEEEGTMSRLRGIREVIASRGFFSTFYSDCGNHYWPTPDAGGQVDKQNLTPFEQAMKRLGIERIAAYSPEARGCPKRMFRTHQDRQPGNWRWPGAATWRAPTAIWPTPIGRPSTPSSCNRPCFSVWPSSRRRCMCIKKRLTCSGSPSTKATSQASNAIQRVANFLILLYHETSR